MKTKTHFLAIRLLCLFTAAAQEPLETLKREIAGPLRIEGSQKNWTDSGKNQPGNSD